ATSFAASGRDVVLLSTERRPGEAYGVLLRASRGARGAEQLGDRVSDFRLSSRGEVVFLARFDARARAGALMTAARGSAPREVADGAELHLAKGSGPVRRAGTAKGRLQGRAVDSSPGRLGGAAQGRRRRLRLPADAGRKGPSLEGALRGERAQLFPVPGVRRRFGAAANARRQRGG